TNFSSFDFGSIASSGTSYVALEADSSQWATSSDGLNWEFHAERILPSTPYRDVTWDGDRFVVVGENKVFGSEDGADWSEIATVRPATGTLYFRSVAWDGSRLVGAGQHYVHLGSTPTGFHATSTDGITWENFVAGGEAPFIEVATDGATSIALGETGAIRRLDGSVWADEQSAISGEPIAVLAGGGGFSVFSRSGMSCTSEQAGDWQAGIVRQSDEILISFSSANGTLVAGALTGILRSDNGIDWTREILPPNSGPVVDIDWSGDEFVALGTRVYRSSTGAEWSQDEPAQSITYGHCIEHFGGNAYVGTDNGSADTLVWMENAAGFEPVASGWTGAVVGLISNGSELIAIGTSPFMSSPNGVDWTTPDYGSSLTGDLRDVVHTSDGFIACGENGRLWRSSDGESWTGELIDDFPALNSMIVNDGHLVGAGNRLVHSADGSQWEIAKVGSLQFLDVAFGDNKYVAITARSVPQGVAISADGIDWQSTPIDIDPRFTPLSITWTGSEFLMTSEKSGTAASPDGTNWEVVLLPRPITGISASDTQQVAVTSTNDVYQSADGLHWNRVESIPSARGTVFTGGVFFALGGPSYRSADGIDWQSIRSFYDIVWDGTQFVGVGYGGAAGVSPDGISWTVVPTGVNDSLNCVVSSGTELFAVGNRGTALRSSDGLTWAPVQLETTEALEDLAWLGDQFAALDSRGTIIYSVTDLGQPLGIDANAIWSDGTRTIVVGSFGRIAELIGGAWVEQDSGTSNSLLSITETPQGIRACGTGGCVTDRSPDGAWGVVASWNDYPTRKLDYAPFDIGLSADGGLIGFSESGVIASSRDGRIWERIGGIGGVELNGFTDAYGEGFVVGELGTIASISGGAVLPQQSPVSSDLNAIAGGNDRLVAVGDDGVILLSRGGAEVTGGFHRWADDQGLDPTQIDPDTEPASDGLSYLDAYYFALSPHALDRIHDRANLPFITSNLGVTFRANDSTPDLEVTVERSTDLREWSPVAGRIGDGAWGGSHTVTIISNRDGTETITVGEPELSAETAYYRVRLVRR
ncbi:MAG: hypothetical protein ACR2RV_21810, partial [Verrucomicrobiales bacterium]